MEKGWKREPERWWCEKDLAWHGCLWRWGKKAMEDYVVLKTTDVSPVKPIKSTLPYELWGFLVWHLETGIVCWVLWLGILLMVPSLGKFPHTPGPSNTLLNTEGGWILCRPRDFVFSVYFSPLWLLCSVSVLHLVLLGLSALSSHKLVHWALPWFLLCALWPANSCKTLSWIILGLISLLLIFQGSFAFMSSVLKSLFHTHTHIHTHTHTHAHFFFLSFWTVSGGRVNQVRYSILAIRSCLHHPFLCMLFLKDKTGLFVLHSKFD